jgi:PDZ domain/Aspartyl protease
MTKLLVVLVGIISVAAPALPAQSVPFVYEDARIFVPVSVNGDAPRWFILDTGVPGVMLDADVARQDQLVVTPAGRTNGVGAGSVAIGRTTGVTLRVGDVALTPDGAGVVALDSVLAPYGGRGAPGVIGSTFFREHVVELDFARSIMTLRDPHQYRYDGDGRVMPLHLDGDFPIADAWLTPPAPADRIPMRVLIDLGAKATLLVSEPFIEAQHLMAQFPERVESPLGAGMGGETRYAFSRARSLALDGVTETGPVVGLSVARTLTLRQVDGLVGVEFLRAYRVIFDYARERLILEPTTPAIGSAEYDMSGMFIMSDRVDHHRFTVHEVLSNGPAARAGVRVGDRITSVDGQSATQLTLGALRNVLRSTPGRAVDLTLERGDSTLRRTVHLTRQV